MIITIDEFVLFVVTKCINRMIITIHHLVLYSMNKVKISVTGIFSILITRIDHLV